VSPAGLIPAPGLIGPRTAPKHQLPVDRVADAGPELEPLHLREISHHRRDEVNHRVLRCARRV